MCAGVAELSERWTVDLEVRPMQVRTPSENILLLFLFVSDEYNYFYSSGIPFNKMFIIRQEYKSEDLYRPEVATNLQLNRKFRPLFII